MHRFCLHLQKKSKKQFIDIYNVEFRVRSQNNIDKDIYSKNQASTRRRCRDNAYCLRRFDRAMSTQNNSNRGDEIRAERYKRTRPPTARDVLGSVNSYGDETCYNFVPTHRI